MGRTTISAPAANIRIGAPYATPPNMNSIAVASASPISPPAQSR